MFNLIIGFTDEASSDRILEYTDDHIKAWAAPNQTLDIQRLRNLPTLLMPEPQNSAAEQRAQIGHIEDLTPTRGGYRFRLVPNPALPVLDTGVIEERASALHISGWEFNRTHWAVKDVDLYRALDSDIFGRTDTPKVFTWPRDKPREADLVAVMMPFALEFSPVYDTIKAACAEAGLRAVRADDMWEADHIFDDIIGLIWRARVVISDFTGTNANVFYETGLAHSLGRDTIQITQHFADVPFDLRSIRTLTYYNNSQGRDELSPQITARLRDLASR